MEEISLVVNGQPRTARCDPAASLAVFLREELELRGTKIGCGNGECGACTVVMNGRAVCSCLVPLGRTDGKRIETIESLGRPGNLHPLQRSLIQHGAFQCGFCTPGILMSLVALLQTNPTPTDAEVRTALQGNLCRCTGYVKLLEAVGEVVREAQHGR